MNAEYDPESYICQNNQGAGILVILDSSQSCDTAAAASYTNYRKGYSANDWETTLLQLSPGANKRPTLQLSLVDRMVGAFQNKI
jgi:hypothetical protein